ncbi:MAG: bifunctional tetrahydrofolate synthase/dihydrofolate synthase [Legionellales bacterium]|nr:bifunctional tetrahydrofolate synthase/dihydrofolate synthase [Legionellales bacterium]|tara:strand:- start:17326 stop:18588 length:1263 start_codon:yes stop_codon:yes gene_type:complete
MLAPPQHNATLTDWLQWLEANHPRDIKLGLERVRAAADKLKITEFSCPVITVAGTNGKGSCVALLDAIYRQAGYRTGTFTSPHFIDYNERVCLNGNAVTDSQLINAFTIIHHTCANIPLTYYEYSTLAALVIFQQQALDVVILEVGLGGRLDAVNIIDPSLSIVSSIALDHMEWLGNTRDSIAREKAGIFRAGKPAVCGCLEPPQSLLDYANTIGAPLYLQGRDFQYQEDATSWSWSSQQGEYTNLAKTFFVAQNGATVLMAVELLQNDLPVAEEAIRAGILQATLRGRRQSWPVANGECLLDVAHNPHSCAALADYLVERPVNGRQIAVFAMLADKDIAGCIAAFGDNFSEWHLPALDAERGAGPARLATLLAEAGQANVQLYDSVVEAYHKATHGLGTHDRLVVFGSFHTVAAVMATA